METSLGPRFIVRCCTTSLVRNGNVGLDAVYNPRIVSGATLSRKDIQRLIANVSEAWAKSREAARNYVDFRIKDDSEVFMLICGMALVDTILQKQGRANCVVSAQGVRFGYLYQMLAG